MTPPRGMQLPIQCEGSLLQTASATIDCTTEAQTVLISPVTPVSAPSLPAPAQLKCLHHERQMQLSYSSVKFGVAAFSTTTTSSHDYQLLEPLMLNVYPVEAALEGLDSRWDRICHTPWTAIALE